MNDILQYAIQNGIIDLRGVANEVELRKQKEILESHHIWKGKNGYYYSKVNGKLLKRKELSDLKLLILEKHEQDETTVESIFNLYLETKRSLAPSTEYRYKKAFNKYLFKLKDRPVTSITQYEIESLINGYLKEGLTNSEYKHIRLVVVGIFKTAKKMKLVDFNILELLDDMDVEAHDFIPKQRKKQVLTNDEYQRTIKYLKSNLDILNLGLLLILKTGLRIGEAAALTPKDLGKYYITVNKTARYYNKTYEIVHHTKTDAGTRVVIIPDQDLWILRELKARRTFCDYVFEFRPYTFRKRLYAICDKLGIERISPHKLRKTYASRLFGAGVDERIICSQMGHTDIRTTKQYYIKDTFTPEEKRTLLARVT